MGRLFHLRGLVWILVSVILLFFACQRLPGEEVCPPQEDHAGLGFPKMMGLTQDAGVESRAASTRIQIKSIPQRRSDDWKCGPYHKSIKFYGTPIKIEYIENVGAVGEQTCASLCLSTQLCLAYSFRDVNSSHIACELYEQADETEVISSFTSAVCRTPTVVDELFDNGKYSGPSTAGSDELQIIMMFDQNKFKGAFTFLKSMEHFATKHFRAHLVVPRHLGSACLNLCKDLSINCHIYDFDICEKAIQTMRPYGNPKTHTAAMCKVHITQILPETIDSVMFIDNDVVVVQDPLPCFETFTNEDTHQYIGMSFDMGEACQIDPDACWPIGHSWVVSEGLVCGTEPSRATRVKESGRMKSCAMPGEMEPLQFNAGIIYFNLTKMREVKFVDRLLNVTAQTARMVGVEKLAKWADQEFIANYLRWYPDSLRIQPCGCNYQWTAARRMVKCGGQAVYMGHGWHHGTAEKNRDPYNQLYFHFKECNGTECISPPNAGKTQVAVKARQTPKEIKVHHSFDCPLQSHKCNENLSDPLFIRDTVNVLTRTSGRPHFFAENRRSVLDQSHPYVNHIVLTDDYKSLDYIRAEQMLMIPSRYNEFDAMEPCDKCGASPLRGCGNAPFTTREREIFLDCYCNTSYPMNTYMDELHKQVKSGWVVYLDDDNLLEDRFGLAKALTHSRSANDLLLWRARLGRIVPLDKNYGHKLVRGDCDSANFMYNSKHINNTKWGNTRCGDYRSITSLERVLEPRWMNATVIAANPMRQALGGLGLRGDGAVRVTIVITSCTTEGFRPFWLRNTIRQYLSLEYKSIIDRVILVWNSETVSPPELPADTYILRMKKNSLNNRWTKISESIRTPAVLNLDDDVFINKAGITCMLNWWSQKQDQLVGPFVRKNEGHKYILDELFGRKYYSLMLPRVMMYDSSLLKVYRSIPKEVLNYVDNQEAHCDDIVLNVAISNRMKKPPFRVMLPANTITDYYKICWKSYKNETAGLGLQSKRSELRSECMEWILTHFHDDSLMASNDVGACEPSGRRLHPQKSDLLTDKADNWDSMFDKQSEASICAMGPLS